ncbi:HpaII family restriction endonuclease [Leuconostoc citreum]|uniref:HpaII family restriction endonuclease n=1 Tax=Leuconostoc citreum TaxID=33964 RepID=UPI0032DEDDA3
MSQKSMPKYNKGEWSELYAFLFALDRGKIHGADENMNSISNIYYNIISTFNKNTEYERKNSTNGINVSFSKNNIIRTLPLNDITKELSPLFQHIQSGKSQFEIPSIMPLLNQLNITTLKAGSNSKGDLKIKIHDTFTGSEPTLNFSVKSYIGSNATLLNSSSATTFRYLLSNTLSAQNIDKINAIATRSKMIDKIKTIQQCGATLKYKSVSSDIFNYNLQMIDFSFPNILADLYLESYFVKGKKIPDVINSFVNKNTNIDKELIEYKVRQFLIACALGMVPQTRWTGLDEATGGYIVVKDNSDVLCYHIYNRNKLSDYLYNHTSFDTPSTSRYNLGNIQIDNKNQQYFDLNIQIRFF